jgi:hypothetical protein
MTFHGKLFPCSACGDAFFAEEASAWIVLPLLCLTMHIAVYRTGLVCLFYFSHDGVDMQEM